MTHKEYLVIIDCASTNFSEEPNLPPTFREPARMSEISDEEKLLLETPGESEDEKATILSRNIDPVSAASVYTKIRITVDVRQVELDLYIGLESETSLARLEVRYQCIFKNPFYFSPLWACYLRKFQVGCTLLNLTRCCISCIICICHAFMCCVCGLLKLGSTEKIVLLSDMMGMVLLQIQKFWLSYCNSSANNMDALITLSKLSVLDQRFDTRPEMRLMLGSMSDVEKLGGPSVPARGNVDNESAIDSSPELTMLVLDLRFNPDSQAVVIRVQRPRLLVVVDFLLAVTEFFVPSLGKTASENDPEDSQNLAEICDEHIRLATPLHQQVDDTVVLSCERQLIAEAYDVDEFIYDGCGKTLLLDVKDDEMGPAAWEPFIIIGSGKKLRFKNIRIEVSLCFPKCMVYDVVFSKSAF